MNYFQIHKNKKPKRLIKKSNKFKSIVVPLMVASSVLGAFQIANIQSQPIPKYSYGDDNKIIRLNKLISITEIIKNQIEAFNKIIKSEQQRRFKTTGRYIN